jgi:hypothetical protein
MRKLFSTVLPFFYLGVMIMILAAGFLIFSYLLIFGAIIGFVLFICAWIAEKFAAKKKISTYQQPDKTGRTFDHDEFK